MKIKRKMKITPHFYKKRGSRTFSDHSLSQLLQIASYKKRINDLTKNNRLLTSALQESIVEAASQNSLLKSYARDINQILFARLKLNDMAKNLAKFATDLEEVQNYLNISLPAEYNFFQKKGFSNERIIKVPDVSAIVEEPELSKNETICESSPDDVFLSNSEENVASVNHDIEMTPILFVNDAQETKQKKRSSGIDKGSLTPQLNIDFTFVNQRRSTRSRGKTPSLGKKSSVSGRLISHINAASTPLAQKVERPAQINKVILKSPLDLKNIERKSENLEIPFQNHSNELVAICHDDCSIMQSSDLPINGSESTTSNIDLNQLSELNEEVYPLEPQIDENNSSSRVNLDDNLKISISADERNVNLVNDKLNLENALQNSINISQNNSSFLSDIQVSEIHKYDKEIENVGSLTFCDSDDEDDNGGSEKKSAVSSRIRSSRSKKPLKYSDYFLSDDSDIDSPFKLAVVKRSGSGSKRIKLNSTPNGKSCEKTITENVDGISADVLKEITETDYSVYNLDVSNSKKQKKKHRKKTSSQKSKNKKGNDLPKPLFQKYSVTKLKPGKLKFSKFEKSMEPKTVSKLLENPLQNSCVSPGGILKKTRPSLLTNEDKVNETPLNETRYIDQNQDSKQQSMLQTPKRVSFAPTDLVCKFEKMSESKAVANNRKVRRTSKSAIDLRDLFEEADSPKAIPADNLSKETGVQKPNNSILYDFFAETELYTLTLPKNKELTILPIDNTTFSKPCDSKIAEQTKLLNNDNDKHVLKSPKTPPQFLVLPTGDAVSSKTSASKQMKLAKNGTDKWIEKSPRTLVLCPISPSNDAASSKRSSFIVSEPIKLVNNENDKCIKKSPGTPGSLRITNKLSEKENEIPDKALSELKSEKAEKLIDMLFLESPMTLVKRPKRKSLFKESSDDDSKENISFDCPAPEKSSLKNITCTNKNSSSITPTVKKKISCSKSQTRVHSKISVKKNKKSTLEIKSLEQSPVLSDATNVIAATEETHSRRRSKQVSYKEPSLNKKLRR